MKNNKKIFIILGIVVVLLVIAGGIFAYSNYAKQQEQNRKEQEKLEKEESYYYEKLQSTIDKIEKQNTSVYDLCIEVSNQLKKYGEAKTFYSAYNSYYIKSAFEDVKTEMKTLDDIEPSSKKYDTEHQKIIELYNEYKDIYNIAITIPTMNYEDYSYTIAKEKAEYNTKLEEIRQLVPKVIEKEKY